MRLAIHAHSKRSAQGYIIDQFTNNHERDAGATRGRGNLKSHSTTHTQTQVNNNEGGRAKAAAEIGKEKRDKSVQANNDIGGKAEGNFGVNGAGEFYQ